MKRHIKLLSLLMFLTLSILVAHSPTSIAFDSNISEAASNNPESVINTMIDAIDQKDVPLYISTFTQDNQTEMERVYKEYPASPFFLEKSINLVNMKKLPTEIGHVAASISVFVKIVVA